MDSGYYFMVSHLHRHFQAVLMSTIQLENLTLVITLAGRSQCFTGIVAIFQIHLFATCLCYIPNKYLSTTFSTFLTKYDFQHFCQSQPSHEPFWIIRQPLLCCTSTCYFLSQICYQQLFQSWLFTVWHGCFYGIPFTRIHLNCLCFNIYFSSICVTSIKKSLPIAHLKMHKLWITILVITYSVLDFS